MYFHFPLMNDKCFATSLHSKRCFWCQHITENPLKISFVVFFFKENILNFGFFQMFAHDLIWAMHSQLQYRPSHLEGDTCSTAPQKWRYLGSPGQGAVEFLYQKIIFYFSFVTNEHGGRHFKTMKIFCASSKCSFRF